jgi:hypothetical protein
MIHNPLLMVLAVLNITLLKVLLQVQSFLQLLLLHVQLMVRTVTKLTFKPLVVVSLVLVKVLSVVL